MGHTGRLTDLGLDGLPLEDLELANQLLTPEGEKSLATLTPIHFAEYASEGNWKAYDHLIHLGERLVEVAIGDIERLQISFPPQHGKSELTSAWFLAWLLGKQPWLRCALCSYSLEIAEGWGLRVLEILDRWGLELFGARVSRRKRSAKNFNLEYRRNGRWVRGGGLVCAGVDGPLTSRPVDVAIIDDPFKGKTEADSAAERKKLHTWYGSTLLARMQKGGRIIVIQTRWHEEDLCGWLLQQEAEGGTQWVKCVYPAIALYPDEVPEDARELWPVYPDPLGREPGEPLCPELHPIEQLEEFRRVNGEEDFTAVWQGWPVPGKGGMFDTDWWQEWGLADLPCHYDAARDQWVYTGATRFDDVVSSWDAKYKETEAGAWCVGQVWGRIGANKYLLDSFRGRVGLDGMMDAVREQKRKWPIIRCVVIEAKACGPKAAKRLQAEVPGIVLWKPVGPKEVRAKAQTHHARGGNCFLPAAGAKGYGWARGFKRELAAFPRGTYKDQVDTYVQTMEFFEEKTGFTKPKTKKRKENFERLAS